MRGTWQLQEAQNNLSKVIDDALNEGPQVIIVAGIETAVVLSHEAYRQLLLKEKSLVEFFRESPLVGIDLDLNRDTSALRDGE